MRPSDRVMFGAILHSWEVGQIITSRGRRSRNKVSVGEPADGSLTFSQRNNNNTQNRDLRFFFFVLCFSEGGKKAGNPVHNPNDLFPFCLHIVLLFCSVWFDWDGFGKGWGFHTPFEVSKAHPVNPNQHKRQTTTTTYNIVSTNTRLFCSTKRQPPQMMDVTQQSYLKSAKNNNKQKQQPMRLLLTMDVLVPVLMKNAANRDKWNELQNSVNHQMFECKWHFGVTPQSMSVWVSVFHIWKHFDVSQGVDTPSVCAVPCGVWAFVLVETHGQELQKPRVLLHMDFLYCLKRMMLHNKQSKKATALYFSLFEWRKHLVC